MNKNCLVTIQSLYDLKDQLEKVIKEAEQVQDRTNVSLDIAEYPQTISIELDAAAYMGQCNHHVTICIFDEDE